MLKVSTKGRYGMRIMIDLAQHYTDGKCTNREIIAKEQNLSKKYIHNILTVLRDRGFVKACRGKQGGFTLARRPAEISILEVLEALEGPIVLVDCVCDRKICNMSAKCLTINLWEDMGNMLKDFLASMTLESFIKKYSKRAKIR